MYRRLTAPLFVQVEITTLCTQTCVHCYNFWRQKTCPHCTLAREQADEIARQLIEAKVFRVIITGGEPLLFPEITLHLIKTLAKAGIRVHLNSNLVLLDDLLALSIVDSGIFSVLTSLMSYKPEVHDAIAHRQGAWKAAVNGIKILTVKNHTPGVNMVVSGLNFDDVYGTGKFVAALTGWAFTATKAITPATGIDFPYKLTREQVRETLRILLLLQKETGMFVDALEHYAYCLIGDVASFPLLTNRRCSAAITSCTIGADGTIRPCCHAPTIYGNVFDLGLIAGWNAMEEWRDGSLIPDGCKSCKHLLQCSGGCRVEALVTNGSLKAMDPFATCGEDVISLPGSQAFPPSFLDAKVAVNVPLNWREEPYGIIVASGDGEVAFINQDTALLLRDLIQRGITPISALKDAYQLNQFSLQFLWELVKKKVLVINK